MPANRFNAKRGRFGNAAQGTVVPGRVIKGIPRSNIPRVSDPQTPVPVFDTINEYMYYGEVVDDIEGIAPDDPLPEVDDWTNYDLPEDFAHGDPLPAGIPAGVGYVRLLAGSGPLMYSSWDADADEKGQDIVVEKARPYVIGAQIMPDGQTLRIWFSHRPGDLSDNPAEKIKLQASDNSDVRVWNVTKTDNYVECAVSRTASDYIPDPSFKVFPDDVYYTLKLDAGLLIPNGQSPYFSEELDEPIFVAYPHPRHSYVKVLNRADGETLAAGTRVAIGTANIIKDEVVGDFIRYVFDCAAMGSPAVAEANYLAVATLIGGPELVTGGEVYGIAKYAGTVEATEYRHIPKTATAAAVVLAGEVTEIVIDDGGALYLPGTTVTITGGGGTGATATVSVGTGEEWTVEAVAITDGGSYLTTPPTVAFSPAPIGGITAAGNVIWDGSKVIGIDITIPGKGYTTTPTLTFSSGTAAGTVIMRKKPLKEVTVTNGGSGYVTAPTITFSAPTDTVGETTWEEGLGYASVVASVGMVSPVSGYARIVHDDRSMIPHSIVSTWQDKVWIFWPSFVRLDTEIPEARGAMAVFSPVGSCR